MIAGLMSFNSLLSIMSQEYMHVHVYPLNFASGRVHILLYMSPAVMFVLVDRTDFRFYMLWPDFSSHEINKTK
jgi:hypothetical protein